MSFFRFHVFLAFAALLASCSTHDDKNEVKRTLQQVSQDVVISSVQGGHFNLSLPSVDEKKLSSPVQSFALSIEIGEFKKVVQEKYEAGKLIAVEGLPAGKFKLRLELLAAGGKVLKEGESLGEIVAGKATTIKLTLRNSQDSGKGSLIIKVQEELVPPSPNAADDCKNSDFQLYVHCKLSTFAVKEGYIKDRGDLKVVNIERKGRGLCPPDNTKTACVQGDVYVISSRIRNFKGRSDEANVVWYASVDFKDVTMLKID